MKYTACCEEIMETVQHVSKTAVSVLCDRICEIWT